MTGPIPCRHGLLAGHCPDAYCQLAAPAAPQPAATRSEAVARWERAMEGLPSEAEQALAYYLLGRTWTQESAKRVLQARGWWL